jgi:carbon storage regulator
VKKEVRVLVLTRKMDEQIVIQLGDQDVIVRVVAIDRDRVRLGIIAPPEVPVHREEVLRRIEARAGSLAPVDGREAHEDKRDRSSLGGFARDSRETAKRTTKALA